MFSGLKKLHMKAIPVLAALLLFSLVACSDDDLVQQPAEALALNGDMESDQAQLDSLRSVIEMTAKSVRCEGAEGWNITPMGSKACGGPQFYLAYHESIDAESFLFEVEVYRLTEEAFNEKWGIISTCDVIAEPTGVECAEDLAVLLYDF